VGLINIATSGSSIATSVYPRLGWSVRKLLIADRCYCGNTISHSTKRVGDGDCDRVCMADYQHYCGGSLRLGLYERSDTGGDAATA